MRGVSIRNAVYWKGEKTVFSGYGPNIVKGDFAVSKRKGLSFGSLIFFEGLLFLSC
jgi:hypothetical protein